MGVRWQESKRSQHRRWDSLWEEFSVWVPLAGKKEIDHARVGTLGYHLFNWISAIQEPTRCAVDVADRRLSADDAGKTWAEWFFRGGLVTHRRGRRSTNSSARRKITEPSSATNTEPVNPPGSP